MGRPSQIRVEVIEEHGKLVPRVSGAAVAIFEGTIEA
jgi:predicted PhzF superfamily epimerase YddE/YHI9